eukprot:jgi/Mesvir1/21314/Mv15934-RA.1
MRQASPAAWSNFAGPTRGFAAATQDVSRKYMVVTAVGPDRPGIVSSLTKAALSHGANVEESRMTKLGGDFAIIMMVSVDRAASTKHKALESSLTNIQGLKVFCHWSTDTDARKQARRRYRHLSVSGADDAGLVYKVTEFLAGQDVNIENMETSTTEAPFGGTTLFELESTIGLPTEMSTSSLAEELDKLSTKLGVDIQLSNLKQEAKP